MDSPSFLKASQTLYDETSGIWTTQPTQLVREIKGESVRLFSSKSWIIFYGLVLVIVVSYAALRDATKNGCVGDYGHWCNFLQYFKKNKT